VAIPLKPHETLPGDIHLLARENEPLRSVVRTLRRIRFSRFETCRLQSIGRLLIAARDEMPLEIDRTTNTLSRL
jgi:hypothetical protein